MDADPPVDRGRLHGQGRNRNALVRSTGVVSTACEKGGLSNWGRSGMAEVQAFNIIERTVTSPEDGKGHSTGEAE